MAAAKLIENPLYDKIFINAFISGATVTLDKMASLKVLVEGPSIETTFIPKGDVAGVVEMVSNTFRATLTLSFPRSSIFFILESMLGESHSDVTVEVRDAVGELTNMIYGCAKTTLGDLGYEFELAIPIVILKDTIAAKHAGRATLRIPFKIYGNRSFYLEMSIP